ncbi:unnamed protein product [Brachionus calyciflorus]|uniref:Uncharacterized protein n=1 Tax=Brachionus calyciflorus TaxID=104777 RepID=A0A813MH36_9BILA|nr:unnamed protein product [Brachionus calyciflorus]
MSFDSTNTGIKNNLVNEIARKFETIARSNSSDSSNSSSGLNQISRNRRNDSNESLKSDKKIASNTIAFQQGKKMSYFTLKKAEDQYTSHSEKNLNELENDEINFTIKSTDTNKQSTIKRKNGLELFNLQANHQNDNSDDESLKLKNEVEILREQLNAVNNDLTNFKKKYQEFQLEMESNEKVRSQQVEKLKKKVDFLLKLSFSNSLSQSYDDDQELSEHIIKF